MNKSKQLAIYARVSTGRQEDEQTIEVQTMVFDEYAEKHGFTIIKRYLDDGWSGDILARPALDELRNDAKNKLWDTILFYDPDRLARRYSYQELVIDELTEAGAEVLFITVATAKTAEEKILQGVRGLFTEYERVKIAERFRLGKLRRVKTGNILVSEPLYGYNYVRRTDAELGHYTLNESEAQVVRMIFSWVADEGLTQRKIVKRLFDLNIWPRKSKRGVWATSTLSSMLSNKAYIGKAHWGSTYAVVPENPIKVGRYKKVKKSSRKTRPEVEWHTIPVPSIIDETLYLRARNQIDANYALLKGTAKNQYLLARKIWCICGRSRTGEGPKDGKYLYYRCSDRVSSYPLPHTCKEKSINARIADQLVWASIANLMGQKELIESQVRRWMLQSQTKGSITKIDIEKIEIEISKLQTSIDRYNSAYAEGMYTLEKLKEYTASVQKRISALEGDLVLARKEKSEKGAIMLPGAEAIQAFVEEAKAYLGKSDFSFRKEIIGKTVEKVVSSANALKIIGHLYINPNVESCPNHRDGLGVTPHSQANSFLLPFELDIPIPPLLRTGIDYGFGKNQQGRH